MLTNFLPIYFPFDKFHICRVPYNRAQLLELRSLYNLTHSFFRDGDYIYVSPMQGDDLGIGEYVTLSIEKSVRVASSLIKHLFFRAFRQKYPDLIPLDFYPFRVLSRKNEDDIILDILPADLKGTVALKKMLEVQFREVEDKAGATGFGAVINVRYQWIFNKTCEQLNNEGFALKDLPVLLSQQVSGLEGVIAPDESFIGIVKSVVGDIAIIETNEGQEDFPLNELYLHKSQSGIRRYLEFKLGETRAEKLFTHIREKDQTRLNAKYCYDEVVRMARTSAALKYSNMDGFSFSISPTPLRIDRTFQIYRPTFVFDYNQGATHDNASMGLLNYGPYDSTTFETKHPTILVVCHKSNRGAFTEFVSKLINGIPSSTQFKGGMIGKYRLHEAVIETVELDSYEVEEYGEKIRDYIKRKDVLPHIVIVETREDFKNRRPTNNPYYRTKAYFLLHGIPVQFIQNANIRKPDRDLQWICESVALQIYAKLGGRPWVLPASTSIDHEIIVGIGSSLERETSYAGNAHERIVGITNFFTGDGRYIYGSRCKEVSYDEYFQELLEHLRHSITEISSEYGWRSGDTVRIVFHIFKPIKNIEAEVVDQLLKEFSQYHMKYAFVTVSTQHPHLLFDTQQNGIGDSKKGIFVPAQGVNWILNSHSCLIQLSGPNNIKSARHGFSSPVLVRIHEKSTYTDLNTIVQQVHNFTYLSWRGFFPVQLPVTILYSDLIAKHLASLRRINTWKPELVNSVLKHKKWFL